MDPELKTQWITALRSGDYKQGRFALKNVDPGKDDVYCCLGVLCAIAFVGVNPTAAEQYGWCDKTLGASHITKELAQLNDGAFSAAERCYVDAKTFAEIADYIEANL